LRLVLFQWKVIQEFVVQYNPIKQNQQ
jgi:hypothetical protein